MHRGKSNIPQHRRHKGKNLGYVRIDGRMCYTGKWGTAEAEEKAQRLVRRHLAGLHGERTGSPDWPGDETIEGLSDRDLPAPSSLPLGGAPLHAEAGATGRSHGLGDAYAECSLPSRLSAPVWVDPRQDQGKGSGDLQTISRPLMPRR